MQRKKAITLLALMVTGVLFFTSCVSDLITPEPEVPIPTEISYSADVQPIFTSNCANCHKPGGATPDLTAANSYNSLTSEGLINTTNPSTSKIYTVMITGGSMASYCTSNDAAMVLAWIEQGAKNN